MNPLEFCVERYEYSQFGFAKKIYPPVNLLCLHI